MVGQSPNPLAELLHDHRLIAIIRLDDLTHAIELSRALLAGGIRIQEFTLTNPQALEAFQVVKQNVPEFSNGSAALGIGSVQSLADAERAIERGADFLVTPVFLHEVVEYCGQAKTPIICGAYTPTEIAQASKAGADFIKLFPARSLGPQFVKDVLAPLPNLRIVPTGGVNLDNMHSYFEAGAAAVGIGGNLVDANAIKGAADKQDWTEIEQLAKSYAERARRANQ